MNINPILWTPTPERAAASQLAAYQNWLKRTKGLEFDNYNDLWTWSTTDLEAWASF